MTAALDPIGLRDRVPRPDVIGARFVIDRSAPSRSSRAPAGLVRRVRAVLRGGRDRRQLAIDGRAAGAVLAAIGHAASTGHDESTAELWAVRGGRPGEPTILWVGPADGPPRAVVRIARTVAGRRGLERADLALSQVRPRLAAIGREAIVPAVLGRGDLAGRAWLAESAAAGHSARPLIADPAARRRMLAAASAAIGQVHEATAVVTTLDDDHIRRWVSDRSRRIVDLTERHGGTTRAARMEAIEAPVRAELLGRSVVTSWIHGDLWSANVLVLDEVPVVSGLIDWDSAAPDELPIHDRYHLAITTRRLVERRDLGAVLAAVLRGGGWTDDDRVVLDGPGPESGLSEPTTLWLYWLRFVDTNLERHPELATDSDWLAANVDRVLACV